MFDRLRRIKQFNIPWLGAFTDALYTALPILSIINFISILVVLYASVYENIHEFAPWLTFWHFILALVIVTIVGLLLMYKFVVPSLWTFRQNQMFKHDSDVAKTLMRIDERLARLEEGDKGDSEGSSTAPGVQRRKDNRPDHR